MIPVTYLNKVRTVLEHLETTQLTAVDKAADFVLQAWECGGVIYCHRFGHGIEGDSLFRAGGLLSVKRFSYSIKIEDPVPECRDAVDRKIPVIRAAVALSNLKKNDVMLVSSVSGRNQEVIELSLECRKKNVKVISFSSLAYSAQIDSDHSSGKKLSEVSDVNIDIGAPYGDAAVTIPGIKVPVMPVSGVSMACCAWMIWGRAMEKSSAAGRPPTVLMSNNRSGGPEYNERMIKQYEKRGY